MSPALLVGCVGGGDGEPHGRGRTTRLCPEILLDEPTIAALGQAISLSEWRTSEATGERFGVLGEFTGVVAVLPVEPLPELGEEVTRPWLNPLIYEREKTGHPSYKPTFRPCVALFIRFFGIDYDNPEAIAQLDSFIQQVQQITSHYGGTLIQLTIGDKGSYVYSNFGALQAHEDNSRRAIKVALALREVTPLALKMGIAQGVMRVGAYGNATRRTYGAIGDEVNLAARLMNQAAVGEILVSTPVQQATVTDFVFAAHTAVRLKGKADPIPFFTVINEQKQPTIRLQEPTYNLPMVGRQTELQQIEKKFALAITGHSQIIGIVAEAGWGKSRLLAEAIRLARHQSLIGYGGSCQSDALNTPYHVWKTIGQALLDIDPETPLPQLQPDLEQKIKTCAPNRVAAIPLLNILLGTAIPENEFTRTLEPKTRQTALHALLEDYLKSKAQEQPILIVIEDMHWIDALSYDLLEQLAQATSHLPICFVLAYRPQFTRQSLARLESLPQFTRLELNPVTPAEAEQIIRFKLAQLYPWQGLPLPATQLEPLITRAQGNPFYLEELLNYLRDRGLDPSRH
jgi:adenylate cyclase